MKSRIRMDTRPPTFKESLKATISLSLFFMVVYNSTNYITSLRSDVGTWRYAWEEIIPFVPSMILPYMSIDLFFVFAPFICTTRMELKILFRRLGLAILLGGTMFLLYPLTLAVERPHAEGLVGALFNWFRQIDLPYNLCPSLHIALRTILAACYAKHTKGWLQWASHFWFSLIGLSTLLTYQHHVIDVIGGFILATVCFYLVREAPFKLPVLPNYRVGLMYGGGTLLLTAGAIVGGSWWLWLLWPAVATGFVTMGYFALGPGIYAKQNGRLPLYSRLVLAPVLLGQYLSLVYYRRQCEPWNEVTDKVWIGRLLNDQEAEVAKQQGVTAVIDLTVAFSEAQAFETIEVLPLPVLDLTAPTSGQIQSAIYLIQNHSGIVYVHCKIGYSRSAAIVGCYLLASGAADSAEEAIEKMKSVRPSIVIRPEVRQVIEQYAQT